MSEGSSPELELSLASLGIPWKGSPRLWHTISRNLLHTCTIQGNVIDSSGLILYSLKPLSSLGEGTFGNVDSFRCICQGSERVVAIKRPKYPEVDLFIEALFQWRTHNELKKFSLSFCVPEVYDIFIFKQTGDVWFSMQPFNASLLSVWSLVNLRKENYFGYLMLQIALTLEVLQNVLHIDHRDLKVNNILIVDTPVDINIMWKGKKITVCFPFHIVFVDFGYACARGLVDVKNDGIPLIDFCPKEGRDIFQILVSLWRIKEIRNILEFKWGAWIRTKIDTTQPHLCYLRLVETIADLNWMYAVTDNTSFKAPLCTPIVIITECMHILSLG
jgi:serine/threonine protein kinase